MAWNDPLDLYCERLHEGLWAEPLNAVSNLAFFAAAAGAYLLWKRDGKGDRFILLLIALAVLVGIGSTLFHTFATRWGLFADSIPIGIFVVAFLIYTLRRFLGQSVLATALWILAFLALAALLPRILPPGFLNNSGFYFPVLFALVVLGIVLRAKGGALLWVGGAYLSAAALFMLSLSFRIVDPSVCGAFPLGTHFLWHCLNGALIYLMLWTVIRAKQRA
ncbi:MAG: ceramidase domain-containing protein [Xanthobacteraceae bacterium]|nr:ceramidase domain-containing protein [Xanthobacteraceae bacterium]MBX3535824.1 ceramidase domain-containing protein [Xanthobacteraceae bacterium]MBX3548757.1 ceramidase domain-containing protein [Xanthobacteraceae bacterium]MCW5674391.1 ceramidase domain-containing protein [Xanthobacteraceae bacterium]MCW5678707.1 ceramidase domain-containing protein [Xanthobacteraceae bacterium]